jgi:Bacterial regulatory proteins, luxR family/Ribbon-helix-helix protein, copG family
MNDFADFEEREKWWPSVAPIRTCRFGDSGTKARFSGTIAWHEASTPVVSTETAAGLDHHFVNGGSWVAAFGSSNNIWEECSMHHLPKNKTSVLQTSTWKPGPAHTLEGLTNKQIADHLDVSESSVKATLQQLFDKAGVRTRSQLVRVALEQYRDQL